MQDFTKIKAAYNSNSSSYNDYTTLPFGILERQLLDSALGDCTGLTVLDLGGGTGLKARQVLDHGAASVDVVDISADMIRTGQAIDAQAGREGIRWYEADISQPLDYLGLNDGRPYDLVMANWVFDHADSEAVLERMWANVAAHLRPGGRFVGVRGGDPQSPAAVSGKYGYQYKDFEAIPGGLRLRFLLHITGDDRSGHEGQQQHPPPPPRSPLEFEAAMMEATYSGDTRVPERHGLVDVVNEPFENAAVIREDPEFWKLFLDEPSVFVFKARMRSN